MLHLFYLLLSGVVLLAPLNSTAQTKSFSIGGVFGLTGDAATFGHEELNAAQLAIDEINQQGKIHLTLTIEDSGSTGLGTVNAVKKLVDLDGIKIILGPTWLDTFQGCLPIMDKRGVLAISPSASIPIIKKSPSQYPLVFSTYFNFQREVTSLIESASRRGLKRMTILCDQDPYFVEMRRVALAAAANASLDIVGDSEFSSGETDFRSLIIKAQHNQSTALLFASANQASALAFMKQRSQLAPQLTVLGSHDFEGYERDPSFNGILKRTLYMAPEKPSKEFVAKYQARYSTPPIMTASNSFDAIMLVSKALSSGAETPEQIAVYLRQNEHTSQTFGMIRFSPDGGIESGNFIAQGSLAKEVQESAR